MESAVAVDLTKAGSLQYREAGKYLRLMFARARRARLNGSQWRVLSAVLESTLSYSKGYDRTLCRATCGDGRSRSEGSALNGNASSAQTVGGAGDHLLRTRLEERQDDARWHSAAIYG